MKFSTIQHIEVLNTLLQTGVYVPPTDLTDSKYESCYVDHTTQYEWLLTQQRIHIKSNPHESRSVVWGFIDMPISRHLRIAEPSDCASNCDEYITSYNNSAIIILEVPDELVLKTDYEMWHCALNNAPVIYQDGATDEEYEQLLSVNMTHDQMIESWLTLIDCCKHPVNTTYQGTVWHLQKEWIRFYEQLSF